MRVKELSLLIKQDHHKVHRPAQQTNNGRIKIIITTRQLEFEEIERPPFNPKNVRTLVDTFTRDECGKFIDKFHDEINSILEELFTKGYTLEKFKEDAYYYSKGYPWFFHRWIRSFLFVAKNAEIYSYESILSFLKNKDIFWYYDDPLNSEFINELKNRADTPVVQSCFLREVIDLFENERSGEGLFNTFYKYFKYSFDEERRLPKYKGIDDSIRRKPQGLTDTEKDHFLSLVRIGLVRYSSKDSDGRYLHPVNPIIEKFFDPCAIASWVGISIKEG